MADKLKIEYNTALVIIIPLLILIAKFVPKLSSWISSQFFKLTTKEEEQITAALQIRKDMNSMSMVDEFAKYAKLQRRLNQITLDLESSATCRKNLQSRIYKWVLGIISVIIGVIYLSVVGIIGTTTPVFIVPKYWFFPVHTLLSYPTGIEGAISIPLWTLVTRNVVSLIVKT